MHTSGSKNCSFFKCSSVSQMSSCFMRKTAVKRISFFISCCMRSISNQSLPEHLKCNDSMTLCYATVPKLSWAPLNWAVQKRLLGSEKPCIKFNWKIFRTLKWAQNWASLKTFWARALPNFLSALMLWTVLKSVLKKTNRRLRRETRFGVL